MKAAFAGNITEHTGTIHLTDTSVSASDVNIVAKVTTGVVTAVVTADTAAALVSNLTDVSSNDALTLTVTGSAAASDLNILDGKTSVDVIVNATNVTGSYNDLNSLYVTNVGNFSGLGNEVITVSDTTISAENLSEINGYTTGNVDAPNVTNIEGTLSDINSLYGESGFINLSGNTADLSTSGNFDSVTDFSNINNGEINNLNFATGDDKLSFTDSSSFDNFTNKFNNIDLNSGNDEFDFSSAVTSDLDFSNVSNLETLNFSDNDDSVTFGSDEYTAGIRTLNLGDGTNTADLNADTSSSVSVNGGIGNDEFVLDFSRISEKDYQVDGSTGSDTITLHGYNGQDAQSSLNNVFNSMEKLDLSDSGGTFTIDADVINSWNGASNNEFTISGAGDDTLNITTTDDNYSWSTDGTTWNNTDISDAGAGTYYIDTDNSTPSTDLTIHVVA